MKWQLVFFNEDELTVELEYSIDKIFKEEKCNLKKAVNTSVITSLVTLVCGKISSIVFAPKKDFTYQAPSVRVLAPRHI